MSRTPDSVHARWRSPMLQALIACVFPFLLFSGCTMQTTANFDSNAWKSLRGVTPLENTRGQMLPAARLVAKEGAQRETVIAALGEPDTNDSATHIDTYELGLGAGVDEEYFEIRYQDGRVASTRLARR